MILSIEDQTKIFGKVLYTGDHIHKRFAYLIKGKDISPYGDIFAFRAPMSVTTELIDLEDKIAGDFIESEDAIGFIWEVPGVCPLGAVYFQRLFCSQVGQILSRYIKKPIEVDGDDLMVHDKDGFVQRGIIQTTGKASVSITYSADNIAIGHLGINIKAGDKAPGFAYSTKLSNDQVNRFALEVCDTFNAITKDVWIAANKIQI